MNSRCTLLVTMLPLVLLTAVCVSPISAQVVTFFPPVDSLNVVGSCTPPQLRCTVRENLLSGGDTLLIRSLSGDAICTGFPPTPANTIPSCFFVIRDTANQFRYEVWLRHSQPWYNTPTRMGFDTAYFIPPGGFRLILLVYRGTAIVDSATARFHSRQTGLSVDERSDFGTGCIALLQNYPNPFNPSTSIPFSVYTQSFVTLKIYDVVGREIAALVADRLSRGDYEVQWDASGFPSGVYVYMLQSGAAIQSKKLIAVK